MATKSTTRHKFPMTIDELTHGQELSEPAKWLITEITNTAAKKFGTLTRFYEAIIERDHVLGHHPPGAGPDDLVKPSWLLSTNHQKAKQAARRDGGRILGRGARKLPDWRTVRWAATLCIADGEPQRETLARWAGWWSAAARVERPPGYLGEIIRDGQFQPPLTDPAAAPDVPTCVRLFEQRLAAKLGEQETELELIRAELVEQKTLLSTRETQLQAVALERDELQRTDEQLASELSIKDLRLAELDARLTALRDARGRVDRAHQARVRELQDEVSKGALEAEHARLVALDQQQNIALLLALQAGTGPLKTPALLRAQITAQTGTAATVFDELVGFDYAPEASPSARRLAAYLNAHLTMSGSLLAGYAMVRAATGVFEPQLRLILEAKLVPTTDQMEALISYCPPIAVYGLELHEEARADELITQFHVDNATSTLDGPQRTVAELIARHRRRATRPPEPASHRADEDSLAAPPPALPRPRAAAVMAASAESARQVESTWWERWGIRVKMAIGMLIAISALSVIGWATGAAIVGNTVGSVSFQYTHGSRPTYLTASDGGLQALVWDDLVAGAAPRSTSFRLTPSGSEAKITGLTGILHADSTADCHPAGWWSSRRSVRR